MNLHLFFKCVNFELGASISTRQSGGPAENTAKPGVLIRGGVRHLTTNHIILSANCHGLGEMQNQGWDQALSHSSHGKPTSSPDPTSPTLQAKKEEVEAY